MCTFNISNLDTAIRPITQVIGIQAFNQKSSGASGLALSMFLEVFTKNWK
jgi:hypothetical protein